jgi:hypothetical protein
MERKAALKGGMEVEQRQGRRPGRAHRATPRATRF